MKGNDSGIKTLSQGQKLRKCFVQQFLPLAVDFTYFRSFLKIDRRPGPTDSYSDLISMGGGFTITCEHSFDDANVRNHWSNPWVANVSHNRDQESNTN